MKRLGTVLLCLHVCVFLHHFSSNANIATCRAQSSVHREYTKERPLIYEDAWDLWPYTFLDNSGKPAGYNIDLLKLIFDRLKIPYEIHLKPTAQALEDLRSRKSDLMLGMVANFHDDYTMHYGKNSIQLFTHSVAYPKGASKRVQSINDLSSQKVIVHDGSFSHHLMQDHGWGDNAIPYGDMEKAVQEVSAESNGQVLWNTMSLKWLIHKYNADNLVLDPVEMPSGDYRFMANDPQLLKLLDNTYASLKAEDLLLPLEEKWFYPEKTPQDNSTPRWVYFALAAIILCSLALIVSTLTYKIQERKSIKEGKLRNERLKMILRTCNVRIFTYDVKRDIFAWYGSDKAAKKIYNADFAQHFAPDDFKRMKEAIAQLHEGTIADTQMDMAVADSTGTERLNKIRLSVLRRVKGKCATVIGTMSDITEERNKQQETSSLMRRYSSIFNTAMVDMVYYDKDGYIVNMNERSQINLHLPLETAIKQKVNIKGLLGEKEFDFDEFISIGRFYATIFLDAGNGLATTYTKNRDAITFYELQLVAVVGSNRRLLGIYGTGREVSENAKTYLKAREGVKKLRKAMQDETEYVNNINYALQVGGIRMINYSPESHMLTINHRMHEAQYVLTQQRCLQLAGQTCQRIIMRAFRTMDRRKNTSIDRDIRTTLRLPGNRRLSMQMHIFPNIDKNGNVTSYSGIFRDNTEIVHTEIMLQQKSEKAQEIEHVKNMFLHNMCHEIRTPLNIVVGFAEMFESSQSPEEEEMFINEIKENSAYLLKLINDILFLSRLDAGMVEKNILECDFSKTFEGHCTMGMSHQVNEGVKFVIENRYQQLDLLIDDTNVGRIIHQVVENAFKHTREGSVHARYEYIGGKLIIGISDTGEGIEKEKLEHIFDRFNATSQSTQGTGLGLPICKELASMLGGTIDISSEVGTGTNVWITIPCKAINIVHKKEA